MRKRIYLGIAMSWAFFLMEAPGQFMEVGLTGGVATYSGDLSKNDFGLYTDNARPAIGAFLRAPLHDWFSIRAGYTFARLESTDAFPSRGLNFRTDVSELALSVEFHPWKLGSEMTTFSPYLTAGAGYFRFNPQGWDGTHWVNLRPLGTEGQQLPDGPEPYDLNQFNLPVGIGLKWQVDNKVIIGIEWLGRKLFTDYLDDISDTRVDYEQLLEISGPLSARMSYPNYDPENNEESSYQRGGSYNDWFHTLSFTVAFPIGKSKEDRSSSRQKRRSNSKCYKFQKN